MSSEFVDFSFTKVYRDWVLFTSTNLAAPSFRLITALRLLAMGYEMACIPTADKEDAVCQPWKDTLLGKSHRISSGNEAGWRIILTTICNFVVDEGCTGLQRTLRSRLDQKNYSWPGWMRDNIALLWSEQIMVARAVLRDLEDGIEF